ncbi:hypothetical protein [Micromonospora coerulea]|uniref:hypothetical protein n=1 Tax=Micromonospora coerulea TaxID=47856 RepID=UPI0019079EFB|nr:hypothetical protein [Micromonospora veneta]
MAFRTWGRLLLTALGVSVLAGAGQLGVAYGFGIVHLGGAFTDSSINRWPAQLVWVAWFAAVAAVAGAVGTERLARRDGFSGGTGEQLSVAGAAALGAIVVAPLCMQPARAAELGGTVDPVWAVGICAILGAVVGAGTALAVLLNPPLGWNIALTAGVVWLLALVSVAPALASTGQLPTVRLGVLEPSWLDAATAQSLAMLILPTVALLAGAAVGALARRRGHPPLVGGAAGAAGPVLVAFAYLTAGPGVAADRYQLAPYYGALIAVAAGLLGSAATTVLPRPSQAPATDAIEPTDILQPLPAGPATTPAGPTDRAADGPTTADPSHADPGHLPAARHTEAAGAGRPTPAHWDWPATSSGTPTPAPATVFHPTAGTPASSADHDGVAGPSAGPDSDRPLASPTAVPADGRELTATASGAAGDDPGRPAGSAALDALGGDRASGTPAPVRPGGAAPLFDHDDPIQSLPASAPLSPARRISAIDVVAAGRTPAAPRPAMTTAPDPALAASAAPPAPPAPAPPAGTPVPPATPTGTAGTTTSTADVAAARTAGGGASASRRQGRRPATAPGAGTRGTDVPAGAPADDAREPATQPPAVTAPEAQAPPAAARSGLAGTGADKAGSPAGSTSAPLAAPPATGRPKRTRKSRSAATPAAETLPGTAAPAETLPGTAAPAETVPATAAPGETTTATAGTPTSPDVTAPSSLDVTAPATAETPAPAGTPAPADAPAPAGADPDTAGAAAQPGHGFSPRPRLPIFADDADRRGEVRPAWPIAPAPARPPAPRQTANPAASTPDPVTADGDGPVEPAPRPRHRALPDLGRAASWNALASARRTAPDPVEPAASATARRTAPDPVDPTASPDDRGGAPDADGQAAGDQTPPTVADREEAPAGKPRRGLFRRNRAKGGEETATDRDSRESEPVPAHDEEYVDWVTGLGRPAPDSDSGSLRTGRHHRD